MFRRVSWWTIGAACVALALCACSIKAGNEGASDPFIELNAEWPTPCAEKKGD